MKVIGTIKTIKIVSDLFLPLSGEIVEVNSIIISTLVNKKNLGNDNDCSEHRRHE